MYVERSTSYRVHWNWIFKILFLNHISNHLLEMNHEFMNFSQAFVIFVMFFEAIKLKIKVQCSL